MKKEIQALGTVDFCKSRLDYANIGVTLAVSDLDSGIDVQYDQFKNWFGRDLMKEHGISINDVNLQSSIELYLNFCEVDTFFTLSYRFTARDKAGKIIRHEIYEPHNIDLTDEDAMFVKCRIVKMLTDKIF